MSRLAGSPEFATQDDASDPRYAWVMLPLAMLMHIATSPAQTFGVSLFNQPIRESLGLSHSVLTGSYLVASLLAAVPLMAIGRRMDRHGLKLVSLLLVVMVGLACVVMAQVQGVVGLTIGFFLLRVFGQGGLSMAAQNTLGTWFVRHLGMASGLLGVGMAAAIAVMPRAHLALIEALGWRTAYMVIGTLTCAILVPAVALVYRNSPRVAHGKQAALGAAAEPASDDHRDFDLAMAIRTPAYWVAATCISLTGMICTAVFFNLVPLFEQQGLTASQAAAVFPTVAIAMATMQLSGGIFADRLPLGRLMAIAMMSLAAGVAVLDGAHTLLAAHLSALLIGAGQGLLAVTGNTLWPRFFGRQHLGAIRSSVWTATVAACSTGPFIMGLTLDLTGGYGPSLWLFVILATSAAVAAAVGAAPPELTVRGEVAPSTS